MPSLWHVAHRGPSHDLIIFAVVIVRRRKAAKADIGCSLEVGVLYARGDRDLLGIGIIDNIDSSAGRDTEVAQIGRAGIDELVRAPALHSPRTRATFIHESHRFRAAPIVGECRLSALGEESEINVRFAPAAAIAGQWVDNARSRLAVFPTPCARPGDRSD